MHNRIPKKMLAWVLMLTMILSLDVLSVFAAADVSGLLMDKEIVVKQDGVDVTENTDLDFDKSIDIKLSFRVPVIGDGDAFTEFVAKGDVASIKLAEGFEVLEGLGGFELKHGEIKVGTLNLSTSGAGISAITTANIVFDGDLAVFDGSDGWSNVVCTFNATLKYDGPGQGASDANYDVTLLDKTFKVNIPAWPIELTGSKSGDRDGQFIDWTVEVAAKQNEIPVVTDLGGFRFSDNLSAVGEYVDGSFRIDDKADGTGAVVPDPTASYVGTELAYTFPTSTTSPKYIFFRTKISDNLFFANGSKTITNTAKVLDGTVEKLSKSGAVPFDVKWIEKEGATTFTKGTNVGEIIWTITANQLGATLTNAVITDALDSRLLWEEAIFKIFDGTNWVK